VANGPSIVAGFTCNFVYQRIVVCYFSPATGSVQCCFQMEAENLNFFPMNRALSLAREDVDETDTKLDELIAQVDLLVRKQREQVREECPALYAATPTPHDVMLDIDNLLPNSAPKAWGSGPAGTEGVGYM